MKIIVRNNTKLNTSKEFQEAKDFFKAKGIEFDFIFKDEVFLTAIISKKKFKGYNPVNGNPETVSYYGLKTIPKLDSSYDINIFLWDIDTVAKPTDGTPTSWGGECIELAINQYLLDKGEVDKRITHELMHALCYKANQVGIYNTDEMDMTKKGEAFYLNDTPDAPDGNYARTFNNLKEYLNKPMYKYFKESEVIGLKPEFVKKLDEARGIAGVPFVITSGYRDAFKNAEVNGVSNSAHTQGLAVDLRIKDSVTGGKILLALIKVGLNRFGFYSDNHIHVDYDLTKPNPCYWVIIK